MPQTMTVQPLATLLRRNAGVRSVAYLGSMIGILLVATRAAKTADTPHPYHIHHLAFPGVIVLTGLFARLRAEDWEAWRRLPCEQDFKHLAGGAATGFLAIGSLFAVATAQGWVSAPQWGWEQAQITPAAVASSVALTAAHAAVLVFDEEMVFRGYGFDALRDALGLAGALAVSIPLFALYHGPGWKRLVGLSIAGLFLALFRLRTGSLWFGAGFHFAWNVMQEGVFGPLDQAVSLRPLHVHGPVAWIGRPGYPQPGWLQMIWMTAIACLAGVSLWRSRASRRRR